MRSILIVDPNPELRRFVADILARGGHAVRQTDDIRGAAALLRARPTDVLVTDLALPDRCTADAIGELRREFPGLEIIAFSAASDSTGYLRLAATLGGPRTLAQPFMSRELMSLLNEMVAGVAAHRAHADYQQSRRHALPGRN